MKSGWIVWLTVAAAFGITQARAAEPEKQIRVEIRALRVTDDCFEKMCKCAAVRAKPTCCDQSACGDKSSCCEKSNCCPKSCCEAKPKTCQSLPAVMPSCQAKCMMEAIQSDARCDMICCPRVTTLNGQTAAVRIGSSEKYVTAVVQVRFQGRNVSIPTETDSESGMHLRVLPIIAPDGTSVIMSVNCQQTELDCSPAPLAPVATTITPVYEGGAEGKPIPFTQFIQQPSFTTRGAHRFAVCKDGQTMVFDCGRSTRVLETDNSMPFVCDLPVIGEMFRSKNTEVVSDRLVVFVTPCVCTGEAAEECVQPPRVADDQSAFGFPVMCELPAETLPVAPRPACAPPCVVPCPTAACPAVAAFTQATPVPATHAPPPADGCGFVFIHHGKLTVAPPASVCPAGAPCAPAAAQGCWVAAPLTPPVAGCPVPACMATPVRMAGAVTAVAPCSGNDLQLVNFMIEYHEACAAGDKAKARNLAAKCIALDPTCFGK